MEGVLLGLLSWIISVLLAFGLAMPLSDVMGRTILNMPLDYHYNTQAMFQGGEQFWPKWNEQIRNILIKNQASDGHWPIPPKSKKIIGSRME